MDLSRLVGKICRFWKLSVYVLEGRERRGKEEWRYERDRRLFMMTVTKEWKEKDLVQ